MKKEKLVCVFAHPDDESFGPSGTIAKFADRGEVYIICVTNGNDKTNGRIKNLSQKRKKELKKAATILGVKKVFFLGYEDGELRNDLYHEVAAKIEKILLKIKPDTLMTFELRGISGHIDHVFCSMVTSYLFQKLPFVRKLLYAVTTKDVSDNMKNYFIYFPDGYEKSEVDLVVDVSKYWSQKIQSVKAHKSQKKDVEQILAWLKSTPKEEDFLVKSK